MRDELMAEPDSKSSRKPGPGRLFWFVGLVVGIVAGCAVAIAVTGSIDSSLVGGS
jgi:hypothetical protein